LHAWVRLMNETMDDTIAKIREERQIFLGGGHYIAIDPKTVKAGEDGTFVAQGKRKAAGLFWDPLLEEVSVMYDSKGKFFDYDSLSEE